MKTIRKIFIIYGILLTVILLFKFDISVNSIMQKVDSVRSAREQGAWNISLIPFRTILSQLRLFRHIPGIVIKNLVGNVAVFVPFGFLLPMGYKAMATYRRTILAGLIYILMIECIQFFGMLGSFDVDDILLNGIGITCGYVIFKGISKRKRYHLK